MAVIFIQVSFHRNFISFHWHLLSSHLYHLSVLCDPPRSYTGFYGSLNTIHSHSYFAEAINHLVAVIFIRIPFYFTDIHYHLISRGIFSKIEIGSLWSYAKEWSPPLPFPILFSKTFSPFLSHALPILFQVPSLPEKFKKEHFGQAKSFLKSF